MPDEAQGSLKRLEFAVTRCRPSRNPLDELTDDVLLKVPGNRHVLGLRRSGRLVVPGPEEILRCRSILS